MSGIDSLTPPSAAEAVAPAANTFPNPDTTSGSAAPWAVGLFWHDHPFPTIYVSPTGTAQAYIPDEPSYAYIIWVGTLNVPGEVTYGGGTFSMAHALERQLTTARPLNRSVSGWCLRALFPTP